MSGRLYALVPRSPVGTDQLWDVVFADIHFLLNLMFVMKIFMSEEGLISVSTECPEFFVEYDAWLVA